MPFSYPSARKENLVETIHGLKIADPYRWMEDVDSEETKKFVKEQQALTDSYLKDAPNKEDIKNALKKIWNYEKFSCPIKAGDRYYFFRNTGQNQDIMYSVKSLDDEQPEVFLDPNELSKEGTSALNVSAFSDDGKWFAYSIADGGSDGLRIKIRNAATKEDLAEELNFCQFTKISWTSDSAGFFYSGFQDPKDPKATAHHKIFYHRLGTPQSEDFIAIEFPDQPKALLLGRMNDAGNIMHVQLNEECRNAKWYYAPLSLPVKEKLTTSPIISKIEAEYEYIADGEGQQVYYRTNKNADNFKIARLDLDHLDQPPVDLVPEHADYVLNRVHCVDGDKLLLIYLKDVKQAIEIRQLNDGKLIREFTIPIGCITNVEASRKSSEFFFYFQSFLTPGIIYHFDFKSMSELRVYKEIKLNDFEPSDYVVKQVFYDAKNGITKIPMFIVHPKDLKMDGQNLLYLYAYGGFNIPILPTFDVKNILLVKHFRGVYALANVRGGGEYGTKWYQAGRLLNKQNTLDDIQNAAQYLINEKYTSTDRLTIEGISNGGTLMQICSNQKPDLFGCVIARVGAHDILRYDKFTNGYLWQSDYGPTSSKMHFMNLYRLAAFLNIPLKCQRYAATLILTADHDTRVVPSHSFKLAAHLQDKLGGRLAETPFLLRIDVDAGHGDGKSIAKLIDEITDTYSFIQKTLKAPFYN